MLELESNMWLSWWGEADGVIKGVFLTLVVLSVLSWAVIIYKSVLFTYLSHMETRVSNSLRIGQINYEMIAESSSAQLSRELSKVSVEAVETVRQEELSRQRLSLENQLTLLATIGNTAPFIGLLGTVWGIMHALQSMGSGGGISIEAVALPVGEALAATAMGLFAAIPAVVGYNLLVRRLRKLNVIIDLNTQALLRTISMTPEGIKQ